MRRKTSLTGVILASGLAIAGCGSNDDDAANGSNQASTTESSMSQEDGKQSAGSSELAPEITVKRPEPKQAELNKPIPVTSDGKPVPGAEATVNTLTVGEKCEFGSGDRSTAGTGELKNDQKLVQVKATYTVKPAPGESSEPILLDDPTVIDAADKNRQIISSSYCKIEGSDYQDWIMGAKPGDTTKLYGSWVVPADTKGLVIEGQAFPVN